MRLEFPALVLGSGDHIAGSLLRFGQDLFGCLSNLRVVIGIRGERCSQLIGKSLHIGGQPVTIGFELGNPLLLAGPHGGEEGLSFASRRFDDLIGLPLRFLDDGRAFCVELLQLSREAITVAFEFSNPLLVGNPLSGELGFGLLQGLFGQRCAVNGELLQLGGQTIAFDLESGNTLLLIAPADLEDSLSLESSSRNDLIGLPLCFLDRGAAVPSVR